MQRNRFVGPAGFLSAFNENEELAAADMPKLAQTSIRRIICIVYMN